MDSIGWRGVRPGPSAPHWAVYRICGLECGFFFLQTIKVPNSLSISDPLSKKIVWSEETKPLSEKGVQKDARLPQDYASLRWVVTFDAVSHRGRSEPEQVGGRPSPAQFQHSPKATSREARRPGRFTEHQRNEPFFSTESAERAWRILSLCTNFSVKFPFLTFSTVARSGSRQVLERGSG
jgi:hypothetical protein